MGVIVLKLKNSVKPEEIKSCLVDFGLNVLQKPQGATDCFEVNHGGKARVTVYANGKVLLQGGDKKFEETLTNVLKSFCECVSDVAAAPTNIDLSKKYLLGCDEAGTGEAFGSVFLGISKITKTDFEKLQKSLKPKDVKKENYFKILGLFNQVKPFHEHTTKFFSAVDVDALNKIDMLDKGYKELLSYHKDILSESCIIIDDYGIGYQLNLYLNELKESGAQVIISNKADSYYLPPMLASICARRARMAELEKLSVENVLIDSKSGQEVKFESSSPSDEKTMQWLVTYRLNNPFADFPPFVRRKWKNVREIEAKYPKSVVVSNFSCPQCGLKTNILFFRFDSIRKKTEILCTGDGCGFELTKKIFVNLFDKIGLVLDTSALIDRILSKDLVSTKYFENSKIILPNCVYGEMDTKQPDIKKGAQNEIVFLTQKNKEGCICLCEENTEYWTESTVDNKIRAVARKNGSAILTKDTNLASWTSIGNIVFLIKQR